MCSRARSSVLALALLAVAALLAPPVNAVEADEGSSARPELPRADRTGLHLDDGMDAAIEPEDDAVIVERLDVPDWLVEPKPERDVPNPEMEDLSPTR